MPEATALLGDGLITRHQQCMQPLPQANKAKI
jgi:hypothetical protein